MLLIIVCCHIIVADGDKIAYILLGLCEVTFITSLITVILLVSSIHKQRQRSAGGGELGPLVHIFTLP